MLKRLCPKPYTTFNILNIMDEDFKIRNYHSDDSEEDLPVQRTRKATKKKEWIYKMTFQTNEEALNWINTEDIWSATRMYDTENGRKQLYRCNKVIARGIQCACAVYLLYNDDSLQVTLFATTDDHTHLEILETFNKAPQGINKETKVFIDRLLTLKVYINI